MRKGRKKEHFLGRYFTVIGSSNVKMVADTHGHAAYHSKY